MGKSDGATKVFLSNGNVFADLVNCNIFKGREVVKPEDLQDTNCEEVVSLGTAGKVSGHVERLRDLAMNVVIRQAGGTKYIVVGVENQRKTHLAMPARCMLYDAMRHAENLRRIVEANGRNRPGSDFLSGLRREDRLPPVVTLVVYWGRGPWKGPRTLHDMIDFPVENLRRLCADYRLNLVEPAAMSEKDFEKFRTDLGAVLHYVKLQDNPDELQRLLQEDSRFKTLGREAAEVLAAVTGTTIPISQTEEIIDMCKGEKILLKRAFAEGEQSGFTKGEQSGFTKGEQSGFTKGEQSGFTKGEQSGFTKGEQSGFTKGEQSGFTKGEQSGFTKGEQSGFTKGIQKTVSILKKLSLNMEQIKEKLMEEYGLSANEAQSYLAE